MDEIACLLFDFGNVLIDLDIPGATERLEALAHPGFESEFVHRHFTRVAHRFETGDIDVPQFMHEMMPVVRPGVTEGEICAAWNSMLVGIPRYRLEMLEKLRERFDLYLLSNTNTLHISWVHTHLRTVHDITDFEHRFFNAVYYSHLIGQRKPDQTAFGYVIADSLLIPSRTLFIDDMEENIRTARQLGFQTHLSPPREEIADYLKLTGFY